MLVALSVSWKKAKWIKFSIFAISQPNCCITVLLLLQFHKMSKVASITISARPKSANYDLSPTSPKPDAGIESEAKRPGMTSSDSEEDKHMRRKGSSSGSSPERRFASFFMLI